MYRILTTLALVTAVAAEAPYFSSRPSVNAPSFNYAPQPQQAPAPTPQYAAPAVPLPISQPSAQQYVPYPPTVNVQPRPQPQQQPNYQGYNYERPSIAPVYIQQPQFVPQPTPQPQPVQPFDYPQPQQQQGYSYPSQQGFSLSAQQFSNSQRALPVQNSISFNSQPQIQYQQPQFNQAQQLQTHAFSQPSFSQQSAILDNHVVGHVQNILAQNEDNYARNLGYTHRVSGVALEGASPSVELSAFVQNVPLANAQVAAVQSQSQQAVSSSSGSQSSLAALASGATSRGISSSYGLPTVVDNRSAKSVSSSDDSSNYNFGPSPSQPSPGYGIPN